MKQRIHTTSTEDSLIDRLPSSSGGLRRSVVTVLLASLALFTACVGSLGGLTARASDEWTRTYPLAAGGEVQITNGNGSIDVEGAQGAMVDVRAERIARAATDAAARELLPRITIKEDVKPNQVAIETERLNGFVIGVAVEVKYHVRVPATALVRLRTTNGEITALELAGRLVATTVNGAITGRNLDGGVEARAVNGPVTIEIRSLGEELIDLRTVNGELKLTLPGNAKANLSASVTNGVIDTSGLRLDLMGEQTRRRVRGRLNGGGTPIELSTTNGPIWVAVR
jgi:DUF4097 and DUF4098 domain-containing protein YvlB